MKCKCCGKEKASARVTSFYPYLQNWTTLCDICFLEKRIPYKDMIEFVSLYGDNKEDIPQEKLELIIEELEKIAKERSERFAKTVLDFLKRLIKIDV